MLPETSFHTGHSSSDDSIEPVTPTDHESLDQLWSSLRQQKERKMAKEVPKIESFGGSPQPPSAPVINVPSRPSAASTRPSLKTQKSISTFHESSDGRMMTATFKIPGLKKQDIHVSYQRNRLGVTWESVEITETEEGGRIERREKYNRTIPLPEGTKFSEVRAAMDGRYLILKYPNIRSALVEPR
jgi:HSP20 family molecular chaperone IbpA